MIRYQVASSCVVAPRGCASFTPVDSHLQSRSQYPPATFLTKGMVLVQTTHTPLPFLAPIVYAGPLAHVERMV